MLKLEAINHSFGDKKILNNINLEIETGEIVSILGASGCGKTTLLKIILGIVKQSSGCLLYKGKDITKLDPCERRFSIAFQNYALFPHLNCEQNIRYGLKNCESGSYQESDIKQIIELMDLVSHLNKEIHQLSGGQKQRTSLARALVINPRVLLLDEPLSALDGVIKEKVKKLILKANQELGVTIIMVTHDPEEALSMSHKICLLGQGEVAQFGSPESIINQPTNDYVKGFINDLLHLKHQNISKILALEPVI